MVIPPCPCGNDSHAGDSTSLKGMSIGEDTAFQVRSGSKGSRRSSAGSAVGTAGGFGTFDQSARSGEGRRARPETHERRELGGDNARASRTETDMRSDVDRSPRYPWRRDRLNPSRFRRASSDSDRIELTAEEHSADAPTSQTHWLPLDRSDTPPDYAPPPSPRIGDYPHTAWGERMRREEERERKDPRGNRGWRKWLKVIRRHGKFVGPGMVSSVAYFDPGNWTVDLSAGASYGYKLLFVILASGLAAAVLQVLSLRLGITTGTSLSRQIRLLFLRWRDKFSEVDEEEQARETQDNGDGLDGENETVGAAQALPVTPQTRQSRSRLKKRSWRTKARDKVAGKAIMGGLYTLWALSEIAIISTDLAELLGSAIAINLLIPKIPLYAGVLITASDVFLVLIFMQNKDGGRKGMMLFELLICSLVLCVFASFIILLVQIKPDWGEAFKGFIPSKTLVQPGALYTSIGIIGATIMPHGLYLGSELATIDRLDIAPRPPLVPSGIKDLRTQRLPRLQDFPFQKLLPARWRKSSHDFNGAETPHDRPVISVELDDRKFGGKDLEEATGVTYDLEEKETEGQDDVPTATEKMRLADKARYEAEMRVFDRIRYVVLHIAHATVDTTLSLIGFAISINSSILILASAAFFYGDVSEETRTAAVGADLFSAHDLIKTQLSSVAAFIFALALLCAGQSSSITATLAGQVVSEGFLEWRTSPLVRRMITRMIGIVPSVAVAIAVGRSGISTMLVASQVVLSIVLPTVILPLVYLCSLPEVMTVENGKIPGRQEAKRALAESPATSSGKKNFISWWPVTWLGYLIFAVVVIANAYVLIELFLGKE